MGKWIHFSNKIGHFPREMEFSASGSIHFPGSRREMDWKADSVGSIQIARTQGIPSVIPCWAVAKAVLAEAQTGLTQGISSVCGKSCVAKGDPRGRRPGGVGPVGRWIGRRIPWDPSKSAKRKEFPALIRDGRSQKRSWRRPKPD